MHGARGLLALLSAAALIAAPAAAAAHHAQHTLQARWDGGTVVVHLAVCDAAPGSLAVHVTEWNDTDGARSGVKRRLWRLPTGPGCHAIDRRWTPAIPAGASHTVAIRVHDPAWNAIAIVASGVQGTTSTTG
ncbi:MAG TPA: hypothetical protein VF186_03440 [Gaiellaceae bacterium]|jgi:hypothetical protein